jgi:N-acetylglucosamine-6-phosphate deacetylase
MTIMGRDVRTGLLLAIENDHGLVSSIVALEGYEEEQRWIAPGFIDLQVNGYGGDDVNADGVSAEAIVSLTKKMVQTGVTTFLPTVITSSEAKICAALGAIRSARTQSPLAYEVIPYVHMEGPHISAVDGPRGAHPAAHVRPPSLEELDHWQVASGGLIGMITISPHFPGTAEYIAIVTARGIHVALGHTDAAPEQIREAVDAGARISTHLGNGIAGVIPRHANVLWAQLADDRLTATLIADGHHLPADTLRTMVRAKGLERTILVSDSVALAGMPPGDYETAVGGRVNLNANGRLSLAGTEFLAGAALPLKDGVARSMGAAGISLADAVKLATENPGRFVGGRGVLRVGARCDLVRFTVAEDGRSLCIDSTFVAGERVA